TTQHNNKGFRNSSQEIRWARKNEAGERTNAPILSPRMRRMGAFLCEDLRRIDRSFCDHRLTAALVHCAFVRLLPVSALFSEPASPVCWAWRSPETTPVPGFPLLRFALHGSPNVPRRLHCHF